MRGQEWSADSCLHGHDLHLRRQFVDAHSDPGHEATTAERHDHHGEIVHVLDELEAERALPGDDGRVVEGVHEVQAGLRARAWASSTQSSSESPSRWTEAP